MAHRYILFPVPGLLDKSGRPIGKCVCGRWEDATTEPEVCPNSTQGNFDSITVIPPPTVPSTAFPLIGTLGDSLASLISTASPVGPSIPPPSKHQPVTFEIKPFGSLSEETFNRIKMYPTKLCGNHTLSYGSENDVAMRVHMLLEDIIAALGLPLTVLSEVSTFELRPDLWVIMRSNSIPLAVVEVKRPDVLDSDEELSALDEPTVLGELYDYMMLLPNFYGAHPVFGIVTNFKKWRFAWLPSNDPKVDEMVAREESLPLAPAKESMQDNLKTPLKSKGIDEEKQQSPQGLTPSKQNPPKPRIIHDEVELDDDERQPQDVIPRFMHLSAIIKSDDAVDKSAVVRSIASALLKISKVLCVPFSSPFCNLDKRTILRFTRGPCESVFWDHLRIREGQWDKYARSTKYLYAIEDLGRGADGKVWLTCTASGAVCVLKFVNDKNAKMASIDGRMINLIEHEAACWSRIYPELSKYVAVQEWCGREALKMPHFPSIPFDRRGDFLQQIEGVLMTRFQEKGYIHADIAWRNIGLWKDPKTNAIIPIIYDLATVRPITATDEGWIPKAMRGLLKTCS